MIYVNFYVYNIYIHTDPIIFHIHINIYITWKHACWPRYMSGPHCGSDPLRGKQHLLFIVHSVLRLITKLRILWKIIFYSGWFNSWPFWDGNNVTFEGVKSDLQLGDIPRPRIESPGNWWCHRGRRIGCIAPKRKEEFGCGRLYHGYSTNPRATYPPQK